MSEAELQQLQVLCEAMYCGNKEEQNQAHTILLPLVSNVGNVSKLKNILGSTTHVHTLIFTTSGLLQLITNEWNKIENNEKEELKEFVISYLYNKGVELLNLSSNILGNFVRLYVRIVKLSWLENTNYALITKQVEYFLNSVTSHWIIGLYIYAALIEDMHPQCGVNSAKSRRCAISFRDYVLKDIFKVGIETLEEFVKGSIRIELRVEENRLLMKVLELIYNSLSFDFMGTMINDESSDENISLMIPQSWDIFNEKNIPKLFFDMYEICMSEVDDIRNCCGKYCLRSLILLGSLRKTFFSNEKQKVRYMNEFLGGINKIIEKKIGLHDEDCFHELCRLIGKIDTSIRLQELSTYSNFLSWCNNIYLFTMDGMKNWKYLCNSKHYLLGIWSNMLNIIPPKVIKEINSKTDEKELLNDVMNNKNFFIKKNNNSISNSFNTNNDIDNKYLIICDYIYNITIVFINSRLELAKYICETGDSCEMENPLYNDVLRSEQLELISNLCKLQYNFIGGKILSIFYELKNNHENNLINKSVFIEQTTWLVFIISSIISTSAISNMKFANSDNFKINSELCFLVFSLMEQTNKSSEVFEYLEFAYLNCLELFKKVYINGKKNNNFLKEMRSIASRIVSASGNNNAITNSSNNNVNASGNNFSGSSLISSKNDEENNDPLIDLIISKILFNLNNRLDYDQIIKRSLDLFHDLVSGMNIVCLEDKTPKLIVFARLLLKNEKILKLLHSRDTKFLEVSKYYKYRTNYYLILTKLLFMEQNTNSLSFEEYISPINNLLECIKREIDINGKDIILKNNAIKLSFIGALRDLRGICMACNNVETYNMFFNFFINSHPLEDNKMNILTSLVEVIWDTYEICVPFLKFMCEFVYNKSQRITFPKSSPNGILLFKVVSNILIIISNNLLQKDKFCDIYKEKYKIISLLLNMFNNCLNGDFVNFAIFDLYNDDILNNSLNLALNMCLVIPTNDLLSYIKHLKPYFSFLDLVTKNFFQRILNLEFQLIADIIHNVKEGLCSFDYTVSMTCCSILDNIVTYIFTNRKSSSEQGQIIKNFLESQPQALKEVLNLMFHLILGGNFGSTWSMSQPLLGLILLDAQGYFKIQEQLISQQSEEKKQKLRHSFCKLMDHIDSNLASNNRENFTRNLYTFAQEIRNILI
ncbi:Ran-binding protein, putative [Plasmodium chabaudi chabaudi]|uniref:Exportin-7, putative n=2 Tax=Plasmodium chabaudi TaxID=5825 RepID=A0A077TNG9_PLACU|nr:exportin-7, putative [Plasmodium chabaudi chabaudi]SCM20114.1 Ran-binding protein, putative [Plasmodium chabaudi adami]SCM20950.1 Ran-binding protein, putative [Plasmodium chabaudi chabaudi]SCN59494.1 Ran-binding protein, putative [Plasmodium chabaudi adami]SCN59495.1 Ran-binding protein, putative [Plasmodium chabaudi chabaudi]VTZ68323.1 exportin-7, putative [Plasmodium chabaudi chabaudi]|eukprot:XP_016653754.1 Ran-binding protein, putative [Plasmodium chabaudi chabaudi]